MSQSVSQSVGIMIIMIIIIIIIIVIIIIIIIIIYHINNNQLYLLRAWFRLTLPYCGLVRDIDLCCPCNSVEIKLLFSF